jgi:hypothetical protein
MNNFDERIDAATKAMALLQGDAKTAEGLLREAKLLVVAVLGGTHLEESPEGETLFFGTLRRQLNFLRLRIEELQTGVPWMFIAEKEQGLKS